MKPSPMNCQKSKKEKHMSKVGTKIEEEDQVMLLLTLLQPSYAIHVTKLVVGKESLKLEKVIGKKFQQTKK
jgi:hypothetical protein